MAHELEILDGKASAFYVNEPAWHSEGALLADAPTLDEAIRIARLDYPVELLVPKIEVKTADGTDTYLRDSKVARITYRPDRGIELGRVGVDYRVAQNVDAFKATVGPMLDAGLMTLDAGGVLRQGADAWLLSKLHLPALGEAAQRVLGELGVQPYAAVTVNHSGRRGNSVALTNIRIVCANTLNQFEVSVDGGEKAAGRAYLVRHTGAVVARMAERAQVLFGGLAERAEEVAKAYDLLRGFYLDDAMLQKLVVKPALGGHPAESVGWDRAKPSHERMAEKYQARAERIAYLAKHGKGHVGDGSAWEAYNGLVESLDHDRDLWPVAGSRVQAITDGHLAQRRQRAYVALVGAARKQADGVDL